MFADKLPEAETYVDAIRSWTQFYTSTAPHVVVQRLSRALHSMQCEVEIDEHRYELKVRVVDQYAVQYVVQVFKHAIYDTNIVVFRRRKVFYYYTLQTRQQQAPHHQNCFFLLVVICGGGELLIFIFIIIIINREIISSTEKSTTTINEFCVRLNNLHVCVVNVV